jgi:hypothetical protein
MTTTITCIKSEFRANLRNHYATGVVIDKAQADELDEVIDGLVRQANKHRGTFEGYSAYLDCDFTVTPDEADEIQSAKYEVGDRLHFTPSAGRAPLGTAIDECDVIVTEVVDHGSPTPHSPRFTYVVRALNGSGTQGTDDRELTEITIPTAPDAQTTIKLANAGQALPGDVIGVDARGEQRVIGEIIESGSGWEVFDADGSDWGYWGPTEALTVYRPS